MSDASTAPRNPDVLPNGSTATSTRWARLARSPLFWFCIGFYALAVLSGVRSALVGEQPAGDLISQIALALCLAVWAVADARQRHSPIPRSAQLWFLALAGFVVPGYVIATRGWKGLGWVIFHAVGWLLIAGIAMNIAGLIYFGSAWWAATTGVD